MKSPQLENGYCRIANELLDALSNIRISGEAMQCLLVIFRETYGYNRKSKSISNKQFETKTGICKQHIGRAIQKLKDMNLILVTNNGYRKPPIYKINKDYGSWKKLPKKVTVTNNGYKSNQKRLQEYPIMVTNSDGLKTPKDNIKTYTSNLNLTTFLPISLKFHKQQKKDGQYHQDFKQKLTEDSKVVIHGAEILERLNRIDKEGIEDIKDVLDFILQNDDGKSGEGWHGWKRNVVSLASLRKKRDGEIKYFKIKNQINTVFGYDEVKQICQGDSEKWNREFESIGNGKLRKRRKIIV